MSRLIRPPVELFDPSDDALTRQPIEPPQPVISPTDASEASGDMDGPEPTETPDSGPQDALSVDDRGATVVSKRNA